MAMTKRFPWPLILFLLIISMVVQWSILNKESLSDVSLVVVWSFSQWLPHPLRDKLQRWTWRIWEKDKDIQNNAKHRTMDIDIPVINVQDHRDDILMHLENTYGRDWRKRPLLLRGLWAPDQLQDPRRKLSLAGLLIENLSIPYFTDARRPDAYSPDAKAPLSSIVANITRGAPHKIGSQILVQTFPTLIEEVAPMEVVTQLFGNFFTPESLNGWGPFRMIPSITTVPLFVAWKQVVPSMSTGSSVNITNSLSSPKSPFTALHCEPIGNVAVQLSGEKVWTLVDPMHWHLLRPHLSLDGRAFVASAALMDEKSLVPTYTAVTHAGDAIWVPTWTWHRVDYRESSDMAIGASLFHFRIRDYIVNHPLFAVMIIPALFKELVGYNTQ